MRPPQIRKCKRSFIHISWFVKYVDMLNCAVNRNEWTPCSVPRRRSYVVGWSDTRFLHSHVPRLSALRSDSMRTKYDKLDSIYGPPNLRTKCYIPLTMKVGWFVNNKFRTEENKFIYSRSRWPRVLRCESAAARWLGLRVRILLGALRLLCVMKVEVSAVGWSPGQRSPTECEFITERDQVQH